MLETMFELVDTPTKANEADFWPASVTDTTTLAVSELVAADAALSVKV
jgi:hypothetical protein